MENEAVKKILSDLERGYDLIADKFSSTRSFMWRDLEFVKDMVEPGDRVLDFGCGNGRLAGYFEKRYGEYTGIDVSQKLIRKAEEIYADEKTKFIRVDPLAGKLPFANESFDVIFSIAVFHHLPGKEYRLKAARELYRVLRPGGKLVVSVWNLWQKRFWEYHLEAMKNKLLGKSELDWGDLYIPFRAENEVFYRYHHAFTKGELKKLLSESGFGIAGCKKKHNLICIGERWKGLRVNK